MALGAPRRRLLAAFRLRTPHGRSSTASASGIRPGDRFAVPDLIDKPLAWSFDILPGGRTLAHSVFVALLLRSLVYVLARRVGRTDVGIAFAIGHVSHLLTDIPPTEILSGNLSTTPLVTRTLLEWEFRIG